MEKYLQYNAGDFAEDDSFIRWVKGNSQSIDLDWSSWEKEHPTKASDIIKAKEIVNSIVFVEDLPAADTEDKLWTNIRNSINSGTQEAPKKPARFRLLYLGAAAAIGLVVLMMTVFSESYDTTLQSDFAETKQISLPDGSTVQLNATSTLKYDKASWDENRTLFLEGEAFFDVEKGSKFTVATKNGTVSVLGTSFNVFTRKRDFSVLCETGRVEVKSKGKSKILTPNQKVTLNSKTLQFVERVSDSDKRSSWIKGIYNYRESTLEAVIADLERQLDLEIELPQGSNSTIFTGSFDVNNKEKSLAEVLWPLGLKYEIQGRKVVVSEE